MSHAPPLGRLLLLLLLITPSPLSPHSTRSPSPQIYLIQKLQALNPPRLQNPRASVYRSRADSRPNDRLRSSSICRSSAAAAAEAAVAEEQRHETSVNPTFLPLFHVFIYIKPAQNLQLLYHPQTASSAASLNFHRDQAL